MEYQDKLNALIGLWNQLKVSYAKELRNYDLTFDTAKRRLGQFNYAKKLISLSKVHIEATNLEQMFDVLKHEVAHAYSYYHHRHRGAGVGHAHTSISSRCRAFGSSNSGKRSSSAIHRRLAISKYLGSISMPMNLRPVRIQATPVVPLPT
jgi:predicted SprT family Zn-dependent metalloprotease